MSIGWLSAGDRRLSVWSLAFCLTLAACDDHVKTVASSWPPKRGSVSQYTEQPSDALSAIAVDSGVILPAGAPQKSRYARYYSFRTIRSEQDLPFTGTFGFTLASPVRVWTAVFVRVTGPGSEPPGIWTVAEDQVPQVFHGGCDVINVIADARTGTTLGSWCNMDDRLGDQFRRIPTYFPPNSPLISSHATKVMGSESD